MSRATVSTHVLDVSAGRPAAGVGVSLLNADAVEMGEGMTGDDGRIAALVPDGVEPGLYQLVFSLDEYFGDRPHLFTVVTLDVQIHQATHHHIPLLIGPYSLSSYRGS